MKIEIDITLLNILGISAEEYIFLYSLYYKKDLDYNYPLNIVSNLETLGYIKQLEGSEIALRQETLDLFEGREDKESLFNEFFLSFPLKVPIENGGTRPLRPKSLDAVSVKEIKAKYLRVIGNNTKLHSHILLVLEAEINMRKKSNSLAYMAGIVPYINQRQWEKFEYLLDEDVKTNEKVEGI